jgi:lipase chaperone LimK
MPRLGLRLAALVVIAAVAGLLVLLRSSAQPLLSSPGAAAGAALAAVATGPSATASPASPPATVTAPVAPAPLPRSLAGTQPDGRLAVDENGDLVVDLELRRFFDYYLTATGEEPEAALRARIEAALDARLPARAAGQARALLARYLGYRDAGRGLRAADSANLAERLATVRALRREWLGEAVATAFFGEDERADEAALQRAARTGASGTSASAEATASAGPAEAPVVTLQKEAALRAAGAPPEEIRALRVAAFGPDGADRLEALDRAHAAWRARLEAFRAARDRLGDDPAAVARLLDTSFAPEEALRVRALERAAGRSLE